MSKGEISTENKVDVEIIADYLDNLAKSFRSRKMYVKKGNEILTLEPDNFIEMEIKAAQKKGKEKLSLKFSWFKEIPDDEELIISPKLTKK